MAAALRGGVYLCPDGPEGWRVVRLLDETKRSVRLEPLDPKPFWNPGTELYMRSDEFYRKYRLETAVGEGN